MGSFGAAVNRGIVVPAGAARGSNGASDGIDPDQFARTAIGIAALKD